MKQNNLNVSYKSYKRMNKLISSMRFRDNSWFKKRSSLIWIRIISKFKFIVILQSWPGLNFISSVNWMARRWYSFGHGNLCLHPLVISMIIRKVFSGHENNGCTCTHRGIHNHAGRPCTCVLVPLLNFSEYFSVISKVWY